MTDAARIDRRPCWAAQAILVAVLVLVAACGSSSTPSGSASIVPVTLSAPETPASTATTIPSKAPSPTPSATAKPTPNTVGGPSRIVVTALGIDLPVIGTPDGYPPCGVAMFLPDPFVPPGQSGSVYIYAYARDGLFLPFLSASKVKDGKAMIGMAVDVYTTTSWVFTYTISAVHRHVATDGHAMDGPTSATGPELWLQTGEGARGTGKVLQVQATLANAIATTEAEARPLPSPVVCP